MTHLDDDNISALIDGELKVDVAVEARIHMATCAECHARLERLSLASTSFRRSGVAVMPVGLAERAKAEAAARPHRLVSRLAWVAASVAMMLAAGIALKTLLPAFSIQIQQIISGAAGSMGIGR